MQNNLELNIQHSKLLMYDISKIKIAIITKQNIPINIDNPALNYVQDKERKGDRLFAKVYYDDVEIGRGIILDFYKKFEIVEDFGEPHTRVISFDYHGKTMFQNTYFGNMIYKIKNFKNPPVEDSEREKYIQEITAIFETYIASLKEKTNDLKLTYIPSSTKIPDDIAIKLHNSTQLDIVKVIDKNSLDIVSSKNITSFEEAMNHAKSKYVLDDEKILHNKNSQFVIIDDVLGNGSSIVTSLKKLYDTTNMLNYFLIVVKDVKR